MKKKQHWFEPYKKWGIGVLVSVIVVPCISMNWKHIQVLWATPDRVESVEENDRKQMTSLEQLAKLALDEKVHNEKQDAVYSAQMQSIKEQLQLIKEIKSKK